MPSWPRFRIRTWMVVVAVVALLIPLVTSAVRYMNRPRYWNVVITKKVEIVNPKLVEDGNVIKISRDGPRSASKLRTLESALERRGVEYRIESN